MFKEQESFSHVPSPRERITNSYQRINLSKTPKQIKQEKLEQEVERNKRISILRKQFEELGKFDYSQLN